jgi:hypothetical protein
VSAADPDIAGLAALAPGATRHTEAGITYFHLLGICFPSCGQMLKREALLCVTPHGGYPTRLMLLGRGPKAGNWFGHHALARNWEWLAVSGIMADRPAVEGLAEHLEMYR